MNYYYDGYGNVTTNVDPSRETTITPPTCPSGEQPNWTGTGWACITYVAPSPGPAPSLGTRITPLAFSNRFGSALAALYTAAQTNVTIEIYKDQMWAAPFIDLANPQTIAEVNGLATSGLLTPAQATAILTDPVLASEISIT